MSSALGWAMSVRTVAGKARREAARERRWPRAVGIRGEELGDARRGVERNLVAHAVIAQRGEVAGCGERRLVALARRLEVEAEHVVGGAAHEDERGELVLGVLHRRGEAIGHAARVR